MKRVLIVDDTDVMRMMIRLALEGEGFEIVGEATDGITAVELYQSLRPDVVTLDITMPGQDGLQAARQIKGLDPNANIVMVTALGQEDKIKEAVNLGAKEFLVKPFEPARIVSAREEGLRALGQGGWDEGQPERRGRSGPSRRPRGHRGGQRGGVPEPRAGSPRFESVPARHRHGEHVLSLQRRHRGDRHGPSSPQGARTRG